MNVKVDAERVRLAEKAVRAELLSERTADGHWVGELSSSPVATATAVSALVVAHGNDCVAVLKEELPSDDDARIEELVQSELREMLVDSLRWLARCQNEDGGWGDCTGAQSNIAATLLVQAAFRLTGIPANYADLMAQADQYVAAQGGTAALKRHCDKDKTLVAPILANCALAGMVPWRQVPTLPFETVCLPQQWLARVGLPVERHTIPLLVGVGRTKFYHDPPLNPLSRLIRSSTQSASLKILGQMQAQDGGFLDAIPATAFVVMSLASCGLQDHPIVQRGVEFLLSAVRPDFSWSIVNNLATWNTTLAINSLCKKDNAAHESATTHSQTTDQHPAHNDAHGDDMLTEGCLDWLLACQRTQPQPFVATSSGGWGWSNSAGALPNVDDTAGALLALARFRRESPRLQRDRVEQAAVSGVRWLLEQQNEDGGWSPFSRNGKTHDFEPGASDLTSHAMRALAAWRMIWNAERSAATATREQPTRETQIGSAVERGWRYLESEQAADGNFIPLRFANEYQPGQNNPVYGTARVLVMCAELGRLETELARRASRWLLTAQHTHGGWGPPRAPLDYSGTYESSGTHTWRENDAIAKHCSVEETALAVTALMPLADGNPTCANAVSNGLTWLVNAVEQDQHRHPAILGFYFKKLWYHERLYPLVFAADALSQAARRLEPQRQAVASVG